MGTNNWEMHFRNVMRIQKISGNDEPILCDASWISMDFEKKKKKTRKESHRVGSDTFALRPICAAPQREVARTANGKRRPSSATFPSFLVLFFFHSLSQHSDLTSGQPAFKLAAFKSRSVHESGGQSHRTATTAAGSAWFIGHFGLLI